jgi:Rrf2 family protein
MELTRKGDYAVRVVVDLAAQPAGTTVRTDDLGRRTEVPRAYLTKIVQALARDGLVHTRRGALGGVSLAASPHTISLRRVIEAVEGPMALNRCVTPPPQCARAGTCPVHPVWLRIQALVTRELEAVRIDDLVPAHTPPTRREAS